MPHALEPSYQLLRHGKQFKEFHPYTSVSDPVGRFKQCELIQIASTIIKTGAKLSVGRQIESEQVNCL